MKLGAGTASPVVAALNCDIMRFSLQFKGLSWLQILKYKNLVQHPGDLHSSQFNKTTTATVLEHGFICSDIIDSSVQTSN